MLYLVSIWYPCPHFQQYLVFCSDYFKWHVIIRLRSNSHNFRNHVEMNFFVLTLIQAKKARQSLTHCVFFPVFKVRLIDWSLRSNNISPKFRTCLFLKLIQMNLIYWKCMNIVYLFTDMQIVFCKYLTIVIWQKFCSLFIRV